MYFDIRIGNEGFDIMVLAAATEDFHSNAAD
jgi:hypothetical protein